MVAVYTRSMLARQPGDETAPGERPGAAAHAMEATKFRNDRDRGTVTGQHRFVPFVVEEFGRMGNHAQALIAELAAWGVRTGRLSQPPSWQHRGTPGRVKAWWRQRFHQELSVAAHTHLAQRLLDSYIPSQAV